MTTPKLGLRLNAIAELVSDGHTLVDVGTDHGLLPVNLLISGRIPNAIVCDLHPLPLQKAQRLARSHELRLPKFKAVLSDGLENLEIPQNSTLVIAGMGGQSIISILEKGWEKLKDLKRIVLQPNTRVSAVRRWLVKSGQGLLDEVMIEENGQIYTVLVSEQGRGLLSATDKELHLGPFFFKRRPEVWLKHLEKRHKILTDVHEAAGEKTPQALRSELLWINDIFKST